MPKGNDWLYIGLGVAVLYATYRLTGSGKTINEIIFGENNNNSGNTGTPTDNNWFSGGLRGGHNSWW